MSEQQVERSVAIDICDPDRQTLLPPVWQIKDADAVLILRLNAVAFETTAAVVSANVCPWILAALRRPHRKNSIQVTIPINVAKCHVLCNEGGDDGRTPQVGCGERERAGCTE
jgi:hypothetical protein